MQDDREEEDLTLSERFERMAEPRSNVVNVDGEEPLFEVHDSVKIPTRSTPCHHRVPSNIRGKFGDVDVAIEPRAVQRRP